MIHKCLPTTGHIWKASEINRQDPTDFSRFCTMLMLNHKIHSEFTLHAEKEMPFLFPWAQNNNAILFCYTTERVVHTLKDEFWSLKVALTQCVFHIFILICRESTFCFIRNVSMMALKFRMNIIPAIPWPLWKQDCLSCEAVLSNQGLNMRNKCFSVLQEHCASELCTFCKTQDRVRRTSMREVNFHSVISEDKGTQLLTKKQGC